MRIAILGAGAMGSWFGGHLALNGRDVELLTTNRDHREAVQRDGLALRHAGGEAIVQVPISAPAQISQVIDLVIVLTKTFQLDVALGSISHALKPDTAVLSLQNGLGNEEIIARHVGLENTWIGMTMLPVDRVSPGIIESMGTGTSWFGHAQQSRPAIAERIETLFADSGLDVRHDPDIKNRVWQKVAFNAGMNAVCALTHGTPGLVEASEMAKTLVQDVAKEVASVAEAMGITVDLEAVFATIEFSCRYHGEHMPSMLQDLLAGKRTEVDALNGAIVKYANAHGVAAPLNTHLAGLIRMAEQGHARTV
jgi:2-dehydropantoate 2-reductase